MFYKLQVSYYKFKPAPEISSYSQHFKKYDAIEYMLEE